MFVNAAILCSVVLGYWATQQYTNNPRVEYLMTAIGAFGAALALVIYEIGFARRIKG